jgi:hypothetical protein
MKEFPFPDKAGSMAELENDYVYPKIEKAKVPEIFEAAWAAGVKAAGEFLAGQDARKTGMAALLEQQGVKIEYIEKDYVLGNRRYFCEYMSGKGLVRVYTKSVGLWCKSNDLEYAEGLDLILCHEYYHYLEWTRHGLTSRLYQVPILKIGRWQFGHTGIPSLSEIAANAFAYTCFCDTGAAQEPPRQQEGD